MLAAFLPSLIGHLTDLSRRQPSSFSVCRTWSRRRKAAFFCLPFGAHSTQHLSRGYGAIAHEHQGRIYTEISLTERQDRNYSDEISLNRGKGVLNRDAGEGGSEHLQWPDYSKRERLELATQGTYRDNSTGSAIVSRDQKPLQRNRTSSSPSRAPRPRQSNTGGPAQQPLVPARSRRTRRRPSRMGCK